MRRARFATLVGLVVALGLASDRARAVQGAGNPTVSQLLAAAGRYVADYEASFGAVVAEERYEQTQRLIRRVTTGDVLLFNSGGAGWMVFHEVRSVDNVPFQTEPGRLAALAANPTHDALAGAMLASAASATYTIGPIPRAPVIPTNALTHLRTARQSLGVFELDGMKTVDNVRVALLKFSERPHARMTAADDFTITGRFWIEPDTGRVVQTELTVTSVAYQSKVEVRYASRPAIDVWVPVRMFEQYNVVIPVRNSGLGRGGASPTAYVDGLTTYQAFRRFDLKPGLVIK